MNHDSCLGLLHLPQPLHGCACIEIQPPPPHQPAAPRSRAQCLPDTGTWCPPGLPDPRNAGSRAATAPRLVHSPAAGSDAWPADRIVFPIYAPAFGDSVWDCRVRTEPCCASACAPPLPVASAAVQSPAPDARSHSTTGPIAAARRPLPAPPLRRDGSVLPHSTSLESHKLRHLSSPPGADAHFTVLPNGKRWPLARSSALIQPRVSQAAAFVQPPWR